MTATTGPSWWLEQIGRYPLLTPAQELTYGRQVQEWRTHPDGPDHCPADVKRRGLRGRERFARANLRLVVAVAKRFRRMVPSEAFDDLIQVGNQGLLDAVERFDPSRGYRFSTYAAYWIQMRVTTHLERSERAIRLPTTISPKAAAIPRTIRKLFAHLGREPTRQELAEALGMTTTELDRIGTIGRPCASLDAKVSEDEGVTTLGQIIAAPEAPPLPDDVERLQHHMERLPQRSRLAVQAAYGIGRSTATIAEIAREQGITRKAARTMIQQAVESLRNWLDPEVKQLVLPAPPAVIDEEPLWVVQIRHQLGPPLPRCRRRKASTDQLQLVLPRLAGRHRPRRSRAA